jgi:hypothetical protein
MNRMPARAGGTGDGTVTALPLISIVGGFYFPVALLPGWAQTVAIAKAAFAVVVLPASLCVLYRAICLGQRWGTIIEY